MFIVAYLYNDNGMASWCWEAAHALHELGQPVLLICANEVKLSGTPGVDIIRFNPESKEFTSKSIIARIAREFNGLSSESSGFTYELHKYLQQQNITPSAYFLNQSNFQDPRVNVPQYVVGWAYPTSLQGYISKINRFAKGKSVIDFVREFLGSVGWWRKDWRSYRSATSVLPVSQKMGTELISQGVKARVIYPGTFISTGKPCKHDQQLPKLLIAAQSLEESRKGVAWMIDALKSGSHKKFSLTLVGKASDTFKEWVCADGFPAEFKGFVPRSQLQELMTEHDIFLFGSCLDDWGYVLVEAMSQGLSVVAPKISPFDEIIGDSGVFYSLSSEKDFRDKVFDLLDSDLLSLRTAAWERANKLFSRQAFGQSLLTTFLETKR